MGAGKTSVRIVLDTNVVLSALLFRRGQLVSLREYWTQGRFTPLIDKPCAEELLRVLRYPKFRLTPPEIEMLLGGYLPFTEAVTQVRSGHEDLPRCADLHDQKFLLLVHNGRADILVTGDRALLELAGRTPFEIMTPASFRGRAPK